MLQGCQGNFIHWWNISGEFQPHLGGLYGSQYIFLKSANNNEKLTTAELKIPDMGSKYCPNQKTIIFFIHDNIMTM